MMNGDTFEIKKPCHESFDAMSGDGRARHCARCNKMVHNLSAMRTEEARELLKNRGKICITCSVDGLGDVITTDYEQVREQRLVIAQCVLAACLLLGLYAAATPMVSAVMPGHQPEGITGAVAVLSENPPTPKKPAQQSYTGKTANVMGDLAVLPPPKR